MAEFDYVRANDLEHALTLLNEGKLANRVLAGGTNLLVQVRRGTAHFDRVVDISRVPELKKITLENDIISIGAGVTFSEILRSDLLQARVSLLVEACRHIGGVQTRNQATIGGNVANAASCADVTPVLVCLEAQAVISTPEGKLRQPVAELITGANCTGLPVGALLQRFEFTPPPDPARTVYLRISRRKAMALARLSLAAIALREQSGKVAYLSLVPGAAFDRPQRMTEVEELLIGKQPDEAFFVEAGQRMSALLTDGGAERWSADYKRPVLAALTERALRTVLKE